MDKDKTLTYTLLKKNYGGFWVWVIFFSKLLLAYFYPKTVHEKVLLSFFFLFVSKFIFINTQVSFRMKYFLAYVI